MRIGAYQSVSHICHIFSCYGNSPLPEVANQQTTGYGKHYVISYHKCSVLWSLDSSVIVQCSFSHIPASPFSGLVFSTIPLAYVQPEPSVWRRLFLVHDSSVARPLTSRIGDYNNLFSVYGPSLRSTA